MQASWVAQLQALTRRSWLAFTKDPKAVKVRAIQTVVSAPGHHAVTPLSTVHDSLFSGPGAHLRGHFLPAGARPDGIQEHLRGSLHHPHQLQLRVLSSLTFPIPTKHKNLKAGSPRNVGVRLNTAAHVVLLYFQYISKLQIFSQIT